MSFLLYHAPFIELVFNGLLFLATGQTRHSELLPDETLKTLEKNVFHPVKTPSKLAKRVKKAKKEGKAGSRRGGGSWLSP